jgi:hypothetical protein
MYGTADRLYSPRREPREDAEIINSDTLVVTYYLVATSISNDVVPITGVHSIIPYSAGFGGSNALHGNMMALFGEIVGTQLCLHLSALQGRRSNRRPNTCWPSNGIHQGGLWPTSR